MIFSNVSFNEVAVWNWLLRYICWLILSQLSACRPLVLSTSVCYFMYICSQTFSNSIPFYQLMVEPSGLLRLKISGLLHWGYQCQGFLRFIFTNGEPLGLLRLKVSGLLHWGYQCQGFLHFNLLKVETRSIVVLLYTSAVLFWWNQK